jgi:hypothetical protein
MTIRQKASSFALARSAPSKTTVRGFFKRSLVVRSINAAILYSILKTVLSSIRAYRQNGIIPKRNKVSNRD